MKDSTTMKKTFLLLFIVTFFGCSHKSVPDGFPKLVSVTLTLTQDGTPLSGAIVSLINPNVQFLVGGTTDAQGSVVLHTHGQYKGAPLGKYKVRVVKTESDPAPPAPPTLHGTEFEAYAKLPPPKTYTLIEKQYTQAETTPLELEISRAMIQTFDVGKAVKDPI
jgi:hypothetical protein